MGEAEVPAGSVEQLSDLATSELLRRLKDADEAAKLPGTGLLNLVLLIQKQREPDKDPVEQVELDLLEVIANADLPADRKRELVETELKALTERAGALTDALRGEPDGRV